MTILIAFISFCLGAGLCMVIGVLVGLDQGGLYHDRPVRCRECIYRGEPVDPERPDGWHLCRNNFCIWKLEDFCSEGKKEV